MGGQSVSGRENGGRFGGKRTRSKSRSFAEVALVVTCRKGQRLGGRGKRRKGRRFELIPLKGHHTFGDVTIRVALLVRVNRLCRER